MSKVTRIAIKNFKAIDEFEADFKGCTAILTAGNNKGKTSFLRGVIERIRFIRPEIPVKQGEKEGSGELVLDTGERFEWLFDIKGKDKLIYYSGDGKIKTAVTKTMGEKFFPAVFDIDKFLASTPKEQIAQLQAIVGVDFTDVDVRYAKAYEDRTSKNREAEKYQAKLTPMLKVEKVDTVDLTELQTKKQAERDRLNKIYDDNRNHNDKLRMQYQIDCDNERKIIQDFNTAQDKNQASYASAKAAWETLTTLGYSGQEVVDFCQELLKKVLARKSYVAPSLPEYIQPEKPPETELDKIDAEILTASETNSKAAEYQKYIDHKAATDTARIDAKEADDLVKSIEDERQKMIEGANFPKGISITREGITVDELPLDKNQIGSSKLYIAALKIGAINLGEVRTMYFDASYLDKNSFAEINEWANGESLQLLIEKPDWNDSEIKYELIEEIS